ncbi:MAG: CHAT domain-containing protein [Acidobacteria bacterium]|nr:CHAT domain-containing protein [Acidobacteriota bacterium]MBS1865951.1 CHAT domain-containing protein [Acidobacteriota bacterium]
MLQVACRRSSAQGTALCESAWNQARFGDLHTALISADSGLKDFPQSDSELHWRFFVLKAEVLMRQGRYEESLAFSAQSLPPQFANSDSAVWQLLSRASSFTYLERYPEAERALQSARSLATSSQPQLVGEVLLRLGTLSSLKWDLDAAKSYFLQSLQFAQQSSDRFLEASALGSLGLVSARMERYGESTDWNTKALEIDRSHGLSSLATKAEGNIGWNYYLVGDFENALSHYDLAIKDAIRSGQEQDHAIWLLNSSQVFYDKGDLSLAEKYALDGLQIAERLNDPSNTIYAKQNLALISAATGQTALAQTYVDESFRLEGPNPDQQRQMYTRLIDGQLALLKPDLFKAERTLNEITKDPAATVSLQWEALATLAQVHAAQGKVAIAETEYSRSIDTIAKAQESVEREEFRLSFLSSAIRFYDQYVNFLLQQNRPLDALKIADLSRAQTLEHGLSSSPNPRAGSARPAPGTNVLALATRPQEIARRLGATLLFYQLGQKSSHLWLISPSEIQLHTLPDEAEIDALVASYRKTLLEDPRDPLESGNPAGKNLYEMLIQPVEKSIPTGSRVIILPDGALRSLNFESLPVYRSNPHYWIEDVTVSVASSLSLLSHVRNERPPRSPDLLFFGDPDPPTTDYPRLADAAEEIRAVQKHFNKKSATLFLNKDARASAYLSSEPGKYSYLHFATHGVASVAKPLESAIILTREGDSYKLYARDILQHHLNAYLVSISACDGAGKRNFAGEGLIGLSWAFLRAGAHNVVAGLWETSTASTPQIMDELYGGLTAGKTPAEALRSAKLSLIHSKTKAYRRPFYWAPFQLYSGS